MPRDLMTEDPRSVELIAVEDAGDQIRERRSVQRFCEHICKVFSSCDFDWKDATCGDGLADHVVRDCNMFLVE